MILRLGLAFRVSTFVVFTICLAESNTLLAQQLPANAKEVFRKISRLQDTSFQAYSRLGYACRTIGHRLTGSSNGAAVENLTQQYFIEDGFLNARKAPFKVSTWFRKDVSFEVAPRNSDSFVPFEAVALAHTPIAADIMAPLVDVGNGLRANFSKKASQVRGNIVVLNIGLEPEAGSEGSQHNLHRSEKTALAIEYGAKGVVFVNSAKGDVLLTGTASVDGELISIPALCISNNAGAMLREWLSEERLVGEITMRNESKTVTANNVTAFLPGNELKDEWIVIGGHLDSWDLATGAVDNGVGSFTVQEIARTFKKLGLENNKRSILFSLFMGEEQGLLGSTKMVQGLKPELLKRVKYVLNLDMATNSNNFNAGGRAEAVPFFRQVAQSIREVDTTFKPNPDNGAGLHSDHQPFMLEGIPYASPNAQFQAGVLDCYHSDCDDFNLVQEEAMKKTARYTAFLLYCLANTDKLPAEVLDREATKKWLISHGLKEKLVLGKDWPFEED